MISDIEAIKMKREPFDTIVLHAYKWPGKPQSYSYIGSVTVELMDGVFDEKDIAIATTRYHADLCHRLCAGWNEIKITYDVPASQKFVNMLKSVINATA